MKTRTFNVTKVIETAEGYQIFQVVEKNSHEEAAMFIRQRLAATGIYREETYYINGRTFRG